MTRTNSENHNASLEEAFSFHSCGQSSFDRPAVITVLRVLVAHLLKSPASPDNGNFRSLRSCKVAQSVDVPAMSQVVIENPIINSPFDEPTRHFRFTDEGITNEIVDGRRISSYFVPSPSPRRRAPSSFSSTPSGRRTASRKTSSSTTSAAASRLWREGGYVGVTPTTARLLAYWTDPNREKKLFFCQIEALETAIYITEVAKKYGDAWIENALREANDTSNPGLPRTAFKMATGSGKTVVMAMLIAWHTLNKLANPQDARFSDTFLIVTPGITIRDRLRVLLPNDPRELLPPARHRPGPITGAARPGQDPHHQLPRLPAAREGRRRQDHQVDSGQWADQARSPKRPTRWCAASAASWATRRTSSSSTTKPITATAASRTARMKRSPATIASKPRSATKRPASGFPASRP